MEENSISFLQLVHLSTIPMKFQTSVAPPAFRFWWWPGLGRADDSFYLYIRAVERSLANAHSMTLTSFTRDVWNPDVSGCLRVTMTINSLSSTVFHQVATALWKPELQLDQTAIEQMPSNIWMPCDSNFLFIFYIFTHLFYTTQLLSLHKRHISLLRDRNKSIYLSFLILRLL